MTEDMMNHVNGETTGRKVWPPKPAEAVHVPHVSVPVDEDVVPRLLMQQRAKDFVEAHVDGRTSLEDVRMMAKTIATLIEENNGKFPRR